MKYYSTFILMYLRFLSRQDQGKSHKGRFDTSASWRTLSDRHEPLPFTLFPLRSAPGSASYNLCTSVPECHSARVPFLISRLFTFLPFNQSAPGSASYNLCTSVPECLSAIVPFFFFFLFSFVFIASAQQPLGVKECLLLAYKNNNLIQMADLATTSAIYKSEESRSPLLPSVNLTAQYTRIGEITSFTVPMGPAGARQTFQFGTPDRMNFDARVQYMLFTWGRISRLIDVADLGLNISRIQTERQKVEITDQVLRAVYAIAFNQELVRLEEENVKRAESFRNMAERRFSAGSIPKLEVLRAGVQLKNAQSILNDSQSGVLSSRLLLEKLIGVPAEDLNLNIQLIPVMPPLQEDQAITQALKNRKDLLVFAEQKKINSNFIQAIRAENKPAVTLFSSYNLQNGFDPVNPSRFVRNWNAGLQIGFPVFNGFATRHRIEQTRVDLQKTELQQKEMEELIRMQVKQALVAIKKAGDKINIQEENIVLAREALDVTEQQYSSGIVSSLDLLNAQDTLLRSELTRAQAIFSLILADLDLCRAMEDYSWFAGMN